MKVYLNGEFVAADDAKISVFDHGVLYGDGVFEGIRLYDGNVFRLEEHLERLEWSAKAILLKMPWARAQLSDAVCESCRVNNLRNGYIRLVVTRGVGNLGLNHTLCKDPGIFIIADKISLYPETFYREGLKIITSPTRRINVAAFPPMVKSLNYLNNIMAKAEALHVGYLEAIMLNDEGFVAECTGDNIFINVKGKWLTPYVSAGNLRGITRAAVMDIMRELGMEIVETNLTRYDIWTADECFLTGTAAEVVPVVDLDGREIGDGKPGSSTLQVLEVFRERVKVEGTRI